MVLRRMNSLSQSRYLTLHYLITSEIGAMEKVDDIWNTVTDSGITTSTNSALNAITMTHYLNYDGTSNASMTYGYFVTGEW